MEILTPQQHRSRKYKQPDRIMLNDGRMVTLFPDGSTETRLTDGTILRTNKHDPGTWVKKTCGNVEYIPSDPITEEFVKEKVRVQQELNDAKHRNKIRRQFNTVDFHDTLMDRMDRGRYI